MSARLSDLLQRDLAVDPMIEGVTADSRMVRRGYLFAALPGGRSDGKSFVNAALEQGAAAVLTSAELPGLAAPVVKVADPRRAYALAAAAFWGRQPRTCVAVTGTNGKTSVAGFCRQIFAGAGRSSASMGTLGVRAGDLQLEPAGLTTPDAADVARILCELATGGVTHLALEASSHGLDQRRLDGVKLAAAGFLNLTQDHLDYHGTMGVYRAAKLRLFDALLPRGAVAVLNADSDSYPAFAATAVTHGHTVMSVGKAGQGLKLLGRAADLAGQRLDIRAFGARYNLYLPLAGEFQAANALVAAGLCIAAGEAPEAVMAALEKLEGAPGRLQFVGQAANGASAFVDYAHTPDGLETVLGALRGHVRGRLVVVFGAGGDRDRGKRPLMGAIAARHADLAIVTDDNPRTEDPAAIRADVLAGAAGLVEIGGRRQAIAAAAAGLEAGDILVVAGKGHELGQIVGAEVLPFDDVAETREALGLDRAHG